MSIFALVITNNGQSGGCPSALGSGREPHSWQKPGSVAHSALFSSSSGNDDGGVGARDPWFYFRAPQTETLSPPLSLSVLSPHPALTAPEAQGFPWGAAAAADLCLIYLAADPSPDLSGNLQPQVLIYDLGPRSPEPRK